MKYFFNKKDSFIVVVPFSRSSFLWKNYEWTFLRKVHRTCRRGPHLCPCSPQLPRSKLVERSTSVFRPLTCYRCQQGCTNFLGNKQSSTLFIYLDFRKINKYLYSFSKICIISSINQEFLCSIPPEYNAHNYTVDKTLQSSLGALFLLIVAPISVPCSRDSLFCSDRDFPRRGQPLSSRDLLFRCNIFNHTSTGCKFVV